MKYKLTLEGRKESARRSLQRKMKYSIEDKILEVLRSGTEYSIESIYGVVSDDKTVIGSSSVGKIKSIIALFIGDGWIENTTTTALTGELTGGGVQNE